MREQVKGLVAALVLADACRDASGVQAVCHRCWEGVEAALVAVNEAMQETESLGDPTPGRGPLP